MPNRTPSGLEHKVLAARRRRKRGAVVLAAELGLNPRRSDESWLATRCRICVRSTRSPESRCCSSRRSPNRYEHPIAGAMVHIDVKKLGRIPAAVDGGCTAATPRSQLPTGTEQP